jgi:hypothetical protein
MELRRTTANAAESRIIPALAIVAVLATLEQAAMPFNTDASCLLTFTQRMLHGERLYRDLLEINPPLIFWFNIPAAWLADVLKVSPDLVYRFFVGALALASTFLVVRQLRTVTTLSNAVVATSIAFVLLLLPAGAFAEREHLALILVLPWLAEGARDRLARSSLVLATAAGIGLALKPTCAALVLLRAVHRQRLDRSDVLILAIAGLYVIVMLLLVPEYVPLVRLLGPYYAAYFHPPWIIVLSAPQLLGAAAVVAAYVWRRPELPNAHRTLGDALLVAMGGMAVGGIVQGKGWSYHFLPLTGLAFLLAILIAAPIGAQIWAGLRTKSARLAVAISCAFPAIMLPLLAGRSDPNSLDLLAPSIKAAAPTARRVQVLSWDLADTYPGLVEAGYDVPMSFPSLWVPLIAAQRRLARGRTAIVAPTEMEVGERFAYARVVRDLTRRPADVIVVETAEHQRRTLAFGRPGVTDFLAYYGTDPRIRSLLTWYRQVPGSRNFALYVRR